MGACVDGSNVAFDDAFDHPVEEGGADSVTGVAGPVLLAATVPDLARGDVLAGRYQIEALIGSGGSGRVLRAFDRVTRSPVALKILRSEFAADPVWTERFSRELRVGRQIQHPNVCRVYDIGEADGHRFLSMELATGGTLRSQMEPGAPARSVDDRIADARAIIQGVAALHAAGIVHRDLKPENILRADDGRLLVSDFGLATDPTAGPATTVMIGTPRYMAPEVVMGDPATVRSDVWALGVVMHEILSGQRPDRSLIKRRRRVYTPPEVGSPRERRLIELCARCSEEDPQARPASAVELRREFEAAVAGRRPGNRALKKQLAWGALALATIATLGVIRDRWTSNAIASSPQLAADAASQPIRFQGLADDWGQKARAIATFSGPVHCMSLLPDGKTVRAIWGSPRMAEDVDPVAGTRKRSPLLPETYAAGCPRISSDGRRLLFSQASAAGTNVYLAQSPEGRNAALLVRGSSPEWLPNEQEFAFAVDSRHVGIFAIKTGEMNIVTDGDPGVRQLGEFAINRAGSRLAVRYAIGPTQSLVVIHALPSLEVVGRVQVPSFAQRLQYGSTGDKLYFALVGADGLLQFHSVEPKSGTIARVGQLPGTNVIEALESSAGLLVMGQHTRSDLWLDGNGKKMVPLTSDGLSFHGTLSPSGYLAIQRRQENSTLAIVLRTPDGVEHAISEGPTDVTPSFSGDGSAFFFAKLKEQSLVECATTTRECHTIHRDHLVPGFPAPSPSGKMVAYLTLMNTPRLRVITRAGQDERDLGPAGGDLCAPYWKTEDRLWVASRPSRDTVSWVEFDVGAGKPTGVTASTDITDGYACRLPAGLLEDATRPRVLAVARDSSELLRTTALGLSR